jgi:putative transposase
MMPVLLSLLQTLRTWGRSRAALQLEIFALRHQLQVLQRTRPRRLRLATIDRCVWVMLSRLWTGWRTALVIVKPETVIAWHRRGFRLWWTWKSRRCLGRPTMPADVRTLIRTMAQANPRWGAPRIHGELLKLGIDVCQATVAKYMGRRRPPPSQTWRTFLRNHIGQIVAADFFVVPTVTYRLLFVLVLLAHDRRRIRHIAVTAHPTAVWTAQQLRGVPVGRGASLLASRSRSCIRLRRGHREGDGNRRSADSPAGALAKCLRRAIYWIRSSRMFRSRDRVQRSRAAPADDPLLFIP